MGRQVRFCDFTADDIRAVARLADECNPGAMWFPWRFDDERPPTRPALEIDTSESGWFVRQVDLARVETWFVAEQGYWVVDQFPSPLIQISRDRIYTMTGHYGDDGIWVPRHDAFVAWYAAIDRRLRKLFPFDRDAKCLRSITEANAGVHGTSREEG